MSSASTMLLHLVGDLVRADASTSPPSLNGLKEDFASNPEAVMSRYGLDREKIAILMSMDRQVIGDRLRREVLEAEVPLWGEPSTSVSGGNAFLLCLIADLIRSDSGVPVPAISGLLAKLASEPGPVMDAYGLDATSREALSSKERAVIGERIRLELLETPSPPPTTLWADPRPSVVVAADTTKLFAAPGQILRLQVDCVLADAEIHLRSVDHDNHIVVPLHLATAKLRDNKVTLTLDLSGVVPDDYSVLIYNSRMLGPIVGTRSVNVARP